MQKTIRVRHHEKKSIYIHNDLSGAAHYFQSRIADRLSNNEDKKGISYEYISWMIMLAFGFEAKINFLGHKLLKKWRERDSYDDKIKMVCKHLGIEINRNEEPFCLIYDLKEFRDTIAHGKPIEEEFDKIIEIAADQSDSIIDLRGTWETQCNPDKIKKIHEATETLWQEMLKRSQINIYETMTHGTGGYTLIDKIETKAK